MNEYFENYSEDTGYELRDSCYGEVTYRSQKGIFILLDDGTESFSYSCSSLKPGSKVLCSILRFGKENLKTLVSVDSVLQYAA